ncbi:hypothetical protein [Maribacter sp. HTCC2170]|uniref:hypothetical protein n=1 Tax=Maribacter sp. (strain HTCC2170 / KCCM 42371) TaxID=313603 RepID=UPI00006BD5A7|nr:hypothetical protein [Maribacter sp. HTCC2170]EAR02967.1 hypothetical protein FB2170_06750 [Maribacter sp. HTCC2170]
MDKKKKIIDRIFKAQGKNGFWKTLPQTHKYYPDYTHYVPNFKATLWTLILLADLEHDQNDPRVKKPLKEIQQHFFDTKHGIYTLKKDHFPIPCLNGNMIYLDAYFNDNPSDKSFRALEFFYKYQRFDDGCYIGDKNEFCSNTSCYGKHSCYWGITKLLKGISFIPKQLRTAQTNDLLNRCIQYVLLHKVCYSSRDSSKVMIKGIDRLTFPNMYKSDFLEILWLLKREKVKSHELDAAIVLLRSKKQEDDNWNLEKQMHNMVTSIGAKDRPNAFVTKRGHEVLEYYS